MSLTFKQQLNILSVGHRTDLENGFSHYHFVGAPFCGLYTKKSTKNQEIKKIAKKVVKEVPLKVSFNEDEGWKMVYETAKLNIGQTYLIEEIVKRQRRFLVQRVKADDPYDPQPYFNKLDDELLFALQATSVLESMAKQRNKLIHSLNGNIDSIKLYPMEQVILNYKNSHLLKNYYYTNDFGDVKLFDNLERNLTNIAIESMMPEDLTPIFISLENRYKLELNLGNEIADYLQQCTNIHPLGIFRDKIINEYLTPIDILHRQCPYCSFNFIFSYESRFSRNQYVVFSGDHVIDYLPNICTETNTCTNCNKNIILTRNYEYIAILKTEQPSESLLERQRRRQRRRDRSDSGSPVPDDEILLRRREDYWSRDREVFRNMVEQTKVEDAKDFIISLPGILSYQEVMEKLKPINTITSLYKIYSSETVYHSFAEVLRLLETHNLFWNFDMDKLITCTDCICSLLKNIRDVPNLISQIPGMDRISFLPGRDNQNVNQFPNMEEETAFQIDEGGLLSKALKFAADFGID